MDPHDALHHAESAVAAACRLCRSVAANRPAALTKEDRSPVTVADFGSQAVLIHLLTRAFPDIPVTGEETADVLRTPDNREIVHRILDAVRAVLPEVTPDDLLQLIDKGGHPGGADGPFWTIDPIDGTKGFLRGDQYAVALALVEAGEVQLGVLGCPHLPLRAARPNGGRGCLFSAVRGQGATMKTLNTREAFPLRVSPVDVLSQASFCESVEPGHSSHAVSEQVARRLGVVAPPYRIDSQCKYAALARGDASIYLRLPTSRSYQEKIWDHAAGSIVVEEAGGMVTDCDGRKLDFSQGRTLRENRGVVGTNGRFHHQVVEAVRQALASVQPPN